MEIYAELKKMLDAGASAAIRSEYDGGIMRRLCGQDERLGWRFERNKDGSPAVLTEYFAPRARFVILGGGHIALPLSQFSAKTGFSVVVYDDRPEFANTNRFPDAAEVICDSFDNMSGRLAIGPDDYVAIITRGHRHDALCLRAILQGEMPFYLGMIGSKRKVAALREMLLEEGADHNRLERLRAPIGLNIGAATPEEIAVSIVAELIAERRLNSSGKVWESADCDLEVIRWLAENSDVSGAIATVVSVKGSTPRGIGAKMVVLPYGQIIGSIGGGCAEGKIRNEALDIIDTGGYRIRAVDLTGTAEENGMVCGGLMEVLIEDLHQSAD